MEKQNKKIEKKPEAKQNSFKLFLSQMGPAEAFTLPAIITIVLIFLFILLLVIIVRWSLHDLGLD